MVRAQTYMHISGHMESFHALGLHKTMRDLCASDSSELCVKICGCNSFTFSGIHVAKVYVDI